MFKVEIRTTCKVCGAPIKQKRFRSYCSVECRNKFFNGKYADRQAEYQRKRQDKLASIPSDKKIQCLICGKWYVQVCTHVLQKHGMTGREYREAFNLEVKRGVVPKWYREMKGEQAIENGTVENLKIGRKFWFKPGSKTAGRYKRSPITIEKLRKMGQIYRKGVARKKK